MSGARKRNGSVGKKGGDSDLGEVSTKLSRDELLRGTAPDPKSLADVMRVLPADKFEIRLGFAFFTFFRVWVSTGVGLYLTMIAPWYLLPLAWVFYGTAATGITSSLSAFPTVPFLFVF